MLGKFRIEAVNVKTRKPEPPLEAEFFDDRTFKLSDGSSGVWAAKGDLISVQSDTFRVVLRINGHGEETFNFSFVNAGGDRFKMTMRKEK